MPPPLKKGERSARLPGLRIPESQYAVLERFAAEADMTVYDLTRDWLVACLEARLAEEQRTKEHTTADGTTAAA